jgi:hypothetical protein
MGVITLQILDGVDRGKIYRGLPTPITIGREEGNMVQLNDERISRFHAKIQEDQGQVILTDLESTNGTRINGEPVQLGILRIGDRIIVGRSVLLFGSPEQIDGAFLPVSGGSRYGDAARDGQRGSLLDKTRCMSAPTDEFAGAVLESDELRFELNFHEDDLLALHPSSGCDRSGEITPRAPPELPVRLTPAQAAQLAELLLFLHQRIASATEMAVQASADESVTLNRAAWHRILRVQMELARYLYRIGHPE